MPGPGGTVRRRLVVHGLVQGVGFRWATVRAAGDLGVRGWVRNRPDGTVEAVAEGGADAVGRLVEWARGGPPHAEVSGVDVVEEAPEGLDGFRVVD